MNGTAVDTHQAAIVTSGVSAGVLAGTFHIAQGTAHHIANHGTDVVGVGVELGADHHVLNIGIGVGTAKHTHIRSGDGATKAGYHMAIAFESAIIQGGFCSNRHPNIGSHVDITRQSEAGARCRCASVLAIDDGDSPSQLFRRVNLILVEVNRLAGHSGNPSLQPVEVIRAIVEFRRDISFKLELAGIVDHHRLRVVRIVEIAQ